MKSPRPRIKSLVKHAKEKAKQRQLSEPSRPRPRIGRPPSGKVPGVRACIFLAEKETLEQGKLAARREGVSFSGYVNRMLRSKLGLEQEACLSAK